MKVAVIISTFYSDISAKLLEGATGAFQKRPELSWDVFEVAGALDIPAIAARCGASGKYEGLLALGCVIQGKTDHYQSVCQGTIYGLQKIAVEYKMPMGFGVLTCKTEDQAVERSGSAERHNKGFQAAQALLQSLDLKI